MASTEYRVGELERRVGKTEDAIASIPVIQRDIETMRLDLVEVKDDTRSLRRALYTTALSIVGSALIFAFTVQEVFK